MVLALGGTAIAFDRVVLGTGITAPESAGAAVTDPAQLPCIDSSALTAHSQSAPCITIADRLDALPLAEASGSLEKLILDPLAHTAQVPVASSPSQQKFSLRSINRSAHGKPMATLCITTANGEPYTRIVRQGDSIEGATLDAIHEDAVDVTINGEAVRLMLPMPTLKGHGPHNPSERINVSRTHETH